MSIDLARFGKVRIDPNSRPRFRFPKGERFLKGPIPMRWLNAAASLPGKTMNVAVCLWHLVGITGSHEVKLTGGTLADAGVKRHAAYRALKALEAAGLVQVQRHRGRCPIVTISEGRTRV
jgi:DNA-binding MarR family transcriptional regulator